MKAIEELSWPEYRRVILAAAALFEHELIDAIDRQDIQRDHEILEMAQVLLAVDGSLGNG
jgi:hypothetical protein